jgi:fumarate reductase subunit D
MKKQIVALMLLMVLLLPMFAGIRRIKNIRRDAPPKDEDDQK